MRTLTLMRHAKSSWEDPALSDHDRPLNGRGKKAAKLMAERLKVSGYRPDLVVVSSALRAQETVKALQKRYDGKLNVVPEPRLYEAGIEVYVDVIRRVDKGVRDLMLVAHNPTIEWFAEALAGSYIRMPTGAYFRVEVPVSWAEFKLKTLNVLDYDFPKSDR